METPLFEFLFYMVTAVALILALILALESDVRKNSPPPHRSSHQYQDHTERVISLPQEDSDSEAAYSKSPVQFFIDKSRLIFEIIVAVLVCGYTLTQVQQLSVVRDQEQRQLRAYVGVIPGDVESFDDNLKMKYNYRIKNYGATPAYHIYSSHQDGDIMLETSYPKTMGGCENRLGYPTIFPTEDRAFGIFGGKFSSEQYDIVRKITYDHVEAEKNNVLPKICSFIMGPFVMWMRSATCDILIGVRPTAGLL